MGKLRIDLGYLNLRVFVFYSLFVSLCVLTMFLSCQIFVEFEIISKWYAFNMMGILFCFVMQFVSRKQKFTIDSLTILLCILIYYLLFRIYFSELTPHNTLVLSLIGFIILYYSFKQILSQNLKHFDLIILAACVTQAIYGLMQYVGLFYVNSEFKIIGSFDNPAGFSACLTAGFPFCFSVLQNKCWQCYFGKVSIVIITLAIILSDSRAGIISIAVISILFLVQKQYDWIKKHRVYTLLFTIIFILFMVELFVYKKDSAIGRVLVWKNSWNMIVDKPILGHDSGIFIGDYMRYQANYFTKNPQSSYSYLADNVTHPFNEYLLLIIEYGVVGLLILIGIFIVILKSSKKITIPLLCLLSVGIFACFSYPMRYPFISVILAYTLANIKPQWEYTFYIHSLVKIFTLTLLGIFCVYLIQDIQFEKCWYRLAQQEILKEKIFLKNYANLHSNWNGNPMFLYNYGAVLNEVGDYKKSNDIMILCESYFNDYDVQMIIADNYYHMSEWNKAEKCYITAQNMVPNRFLPLYKLMLLYEAIENKPKAIEVAIAIINKKVKVSSEIVTMIKNEAKDIVDMLPDNIPK